MHAIVDVKVTGDYQLLLQFADGFKKCIDFQPYLHGPAFQSLQNPEKFSQVRLDKDFGSISWDCGVEFCPDSLREQFPVMTVTDCTA